MNATTITRWTLLPAIAALLLAAAATVAQDAADADAPPAPPDEAPTTADAADQPADASAEDVLNELLRRRAQNPLIEPARPADDADPADTPARAIGVAPGAKNTRLLREGQFILTRRARMIRAAGGVTPWVLSFEADKDGLADPPMFIMPCRMLEDMEKVVADRGDRATFIVSGQVFVYRGANYLLPTLMKLAPHRGNLQP